jgi:hypothetical protein
MRKFKSMALGLTLAALSAGCDSEPTIPAPPPPSPVASVTLARDTATVPIGGTVQLAVTLRDEQGTVLTDRVVAWTSTAPGTVSVSSTGRVTATALGQTKIVATAEGVSDTATVRVPAAPAAVTLAPASAKTATIGPEGGAIQTTDADGVQYTLQVPALALMAPVAITLTPLATATGLPLAGGFVAGADFKPSGLQFAQPATLTILTSAQPGPGQRLVGLTYQGAGEGLALTGAKQESSTFTIVVSHFSGVIAGFGTTQDVEALFQSATQQASQLGTSDVAIDLLIQQATATPRDGAQELHLMEGWFDAVILPTLDQVSTDAQLTQAVGEYEQWRRYWPDFLNLYQHIPGGEDAPSLVTRRTLWELEFVTKVKLAIAANKQLCAAPGLASARVAALNNALFWHRLARYMYFVATAQNGLDLPALQAGLCVTGISQNLVLPDPLEGGRAQSLEVTFALQFTDGVVVPANFVVQTTGTGADLHFPGATALTPPGYYTGLVTPTGAAVSLNLAACYAGGALLALIADEICHSMPLVRDVETTLTISTTTLPTGTVGSSYSATFQASGGTGNYQWSLSAGQLPLGLSLGTNGAITGTPSAAGTSTFTAQVVSGSHTAERPFAISVTQQQSALTIDTSTLPNGTVGVSYSQSLQASGGSGSFQWSVTAGALPPGLSMAASGGITGTPSVGGAFNFTAQVASGALTAQRTLTITIVAAGFTVGDIYVGEWRFPGFLTPAFPAALIFSAARDRAVLCMSPIGITPTAESRLCGALGAPFADDSEFYVYTITFTATFPEPTFQGVRVGVPGDTIRGIISGNGIDLGGRRDFGSLSQTFTMTKR